MFDQLDDYLLEREAMLADAGLTPKQAEAWGWLVDKETS